MQCAAAMALEKVPEAQAVQLVTPAAEYVPAGHGKQIPWVL
jgi:hypothetical protein